MPAERNAFKLGISMIMFLVLLLAILSFLAPTQKGDLHLKVRFPHQEFSTRLKKGSEVLCGGVVVGSVESLVLEKIMNEETKEEVLYSVARITVDSAVGLREDCRIESSELLLGGMGSLIIANRGVGKPIEPDSTINGYPAASIALLTEMLATQLDPEDPTSLLALIQMQLKSEDPQSIVGKLLALLDDIKSVTASIRNEFDVRQKEVMLVKLHSILDNINILTGTLRDEMNRDMDQTVANKLHMVMNSLNSGLSTAVAMLEENRQPIAETVTYIRNTSQILEEQIAERIAQQLDPKSPASLLAKVHLAIDRLGKSLKDINEITAIGLEVVAMNKEQINRMIANFKETSDHLKAAGKEIRRNPWRLLYQPSLEEVAQANVYEAAQSFSEAAARLDDAVVRLQSVSEVSDPQKIFNKQQVSDMLEQLQHTFDQFTEVENVLWKELKIK